MPMIRRRFALAGAVAATAALTPGVAGATAGYGVSATGISRSDNVHGKEAVREQITIQPGGSTGWQWHDGPVYVYVEQGAVTHNEADCGSTQVYSEYTAFVEPGGADNVQLDRNQGTTPLVMDVVSVVPPGSPVAEDAPNPGCRFQ